MNSKKASLDGTLESPPPKKQTLVTDKSVLSCMTAERVMFTYLQ